MELNINAFQITHIVEHIFQYLPARELSSCACVCKLWNIIATEEQKQRRRIAWFFQGAKCKKHLTMHQFSEGCATEKFSSQFETELRQQFRDIKIKPSFCIAFMNSKFLEHFEQLFPSHSTYDKPPRKKVKLKDYEFRHKHLDSVIETTLRKNLPVSCQIGCYVGKNIVATKQDMTRVEAETPAVAGYLFPDLPDGEIKLCKRSLEQLDLLKILGKDCMRKCVLALIEHSPMIHLSVAFHERRDLVTIKETGCVYLVQRENGYIPVFGGPKVQIVSLSTEYMHFQEHVRQSLIEQGIFKNQNVAFLFTQSDTCSHSDHFHEYLPETPIIGLFGNSEVEGDNEKEIKFVKSCFPHSLNNNDLSCYTKCIILSFKALELV